MLQIFVICTSFIFVTFNQYSIYGGTSFFAIILSQFFKNTCKIGCIRLANIHKKLVLFIFHKIVKNFTHICEKILQTCVKLGKSCLVGLGPGQSHCKPTIIINDGAWLNGEIAS
jgi:hypothetical protein